jgi:hypothetical protein
VVKTACCKKTTLPVSSCFFAINEGFARKSGINVAFYKHLLIIRPISAVLLFLLLRPAELSYNSKAHFSGDNLCRFRSSRR